MLLGLALSLPVHAAILVWFAMTAIDRPGAPAAVRTSIELAVLPDAAAVTDAPPADDRGIERSGEVAAEIPPDAPMSSIDGLLAAGTAEGAGLDGGAGPGVGGFGPGGGGGDGFGGGGGGGEGGMPGGGGAGTSFFGIGGQGTRFAFIVDKSGSMEPRMKEVVEEVHRAVSELPDFASVVVAFYDAGDPFMFSPRWERTSPGTLKRLRQWLGQVRAGGTTEPLPAFEQVFALVPRPDVVFFLTDGSIPRDSVERIRQLNARGKRVVVNTVSFGDKSGSAQLLQIAQQADGQFREVAARSRPDVAVPGARGGAP